MNYQDNHPAVAVITTETRRCIVSAFFASRPQSVRSAEFASMEKFAMEKETVYNLVIVDSRYGGEYLEWARSVINPPLAIIVSEDPELDWVSLDRPQASIRLVRPEGLLRAVGCELDRAKAQLEKSSRRQRLVIPPEARRGLAPLGGTTGAPRVRTARLDLRNGTYDLTRSSLRIVASRIANERRTGVLKIRNGEEQAQLHFFLGQTQRAMYGGIEGLAALVRFAHWTRGYATWSDEPVSVAASLDPDTARILIGIAPSMGTV